MSQLAPRDEGDREACRAAHDHAARTVSEADAGDAQPFDGAGDERFVVVPFDEEGGEARPQCLVTVEQAEAFLLA